MHALATVCLFLGLGLGSMVLAKLLSVGAFSVKKRPSFDVHAHSWVVDEHRESLKAAAMPDLYARPKRQLRAGQSRRPL